MKARRARPVGVLPMLFMLCTLRILCTLLMLPMWLLPLPCLQGWRTTFRSCTRPTCMQRTLTMTWCCRRRRWAAAAAAVASIAAAMHCRLGVQCIVRRGSLGIGTPRAARSLLVLV